MGALYAGIILILAALCGVHQFVKPGGEVQVAGSPELVPAAERRANLRPVADAGGRSGRKCPEKRNIPGKCDTSHTLARWPGA
jgi:hypothetical protein